MPFRQELFFLCQERKKQPCFPRLEFAVCNPNSALLQFHQSTLRITQVSAGPHQKRMPHDLGIWLSPN